MSMEDYIAARKEGIKQLHALESRGQDPYLPVLAELVPKLNQMAQVPLGLVQIGLDQIEGTATKGRTTAFARGFLPLLEQDSEFATKWSILYDGIVEDGLRQPIVALEYYNRFYIVEGNKRVSVMRRLDAVNIEANVTRVLPEAEDSERYRVYQEFLSFYADTKLNFIVFSREGSYERLYKLIGKTPGEKWTPEDLFDFQSCFYRFQQAYAARLGGEIPMSACDALLIYLEVFGYNNSVEKTPNEFEQDIEHIRSEFVVAAANKPAALLSQPTEGKPGFLQSVWHRPPQKVRCAFLYNRSPQDSGWSYWHELGRKALEDTFGSRVETVCRENVSQADAESAIEQFIADGYDVVFAASPVFLEACVRQCAAHPGAKILNCSVLASYHNVRSYYLRVYEAKFILGAIAASLSETDEMGYIADYPIYGTPASINAFALGAQLVNPRAKIVLEWSTLPGHSPEAALAARGVHIISSRDISAPHLESRRVRPVSRAGRRHLQPRHAGLGLGQALRRHRPQHPHRRMERRGRTQCRPRHELLYGHVHRRHRSHLLSTPARAHASAGRFAARTHPGRRVPAFRRADCRPERPNPRGGRRGAHSAGNHPHGLSGG